MRTIVMSLAVLCLGTATSQAQLIPQNLKIRVEKADRVLEPVASPSNSNCYAGKDNHFNEIEISPGVFYGYTANGNRNANGLAGQFSTCYMQGTQVYSMPQTYQGVIASGYPNDPNSAYASCGYWLNGTYKSGSTWYGFAHAEGYANTTYGHYCGYPPTTKSMGLLTSTDGVNWTPQGQILANPAENSGGTSPSEYGEGDCTPAVPPSSSYLYLYCRRTDNTQTSIARAPISSNFGQSSWQKLSAPGTWGGAWNSNTTYGIGLYGSSSSIFTNYGNVMLLRTELGGTGIPPGMQMSFSATNDPTSFTRISEPLIYEDDYAFPYGNCAPNCKASGKTASNLTYSDLVAYPSALSGSDGSRNWNGYFILAYTYVANNVDKAGAGTDSSGNIMNHGRTLAMRNVSVSQESTPQSPQVGIALSRWYSSGIKQRISTTEPVPYNYVTAGYSLEQAHNGYLMTVPPSSGSMTVVECASTANFPSSANPDHLVNAYNSSTTPSNYGCDSNYAFLRTAGYLYSSSQGSSTVPVYRCKPNTDSSGNLIGPTYSHFVSNQSDCEGYGTKEYLLGYALAN